MKFDRLMLIAVVFSIWALTVACSSSSEVRSGAPAHSRGKFLGNIFGGGIAPFYFGNYWNQVTPENAGKWGEVEISRNWYNWNKLDSVYNYAKSRGIPFKMHNLIWGKQQPGWITELSTTEQTLAIIDWISNVGARYPHMDFVDVVNEPIHTPPSYKDAMGGSGSTGWDWVIFAFKLARKYCKNAKLLINEYNVENRPYACAEYTNIIMILKSLNLIDGIGCQCHDSGLCTASPETLSNSLAMMAATGLPIYISEMDLAIPVDSVQLVLYKKYFPILWNYPDVKGITLWGYIKGQMWVEDAWLLTPDGKERPALTWLTNYVRENP